MTPKPLLAHRRAVANKIASILDEARFPYYDAPGRRPRYDEGRGAYLVDVFEGDDVRTRVLGPNDVAALAAARRIRFNAPHVEERRRGRAEHFAVHFGRLLREVGGGIADVLVRGAR